MLSRKKNVVYLNIHYDKVYNLRYMIYDTYDYHLPNLMTTICQIKPTFQNLYFSCELFLAAY